MANNLWDYLDVFYPMIGGNAGGCKVNGKNPGTYDITFNGGFSFSSTGIIPNGTNTYANTNYNWQNINPNECHASVYSNSVASSTGTDIGVIVSSDRFLMYTRQTTTFGSSPFLQSGYVQWSNASNDGSGYYLMNRSAGSGASPITGWRNGTQVVSGAGNTYRVNTANRNVYLCARNNNTTADAFTNRTLSFATIGKNLVNSTNIQTLSSIINTFNTTLGRNTY
jgi:hypothetical protein